MKELKSMCDKQLKEIEGTFEVVNKIYFIAAIKDHIETFASQWMTKVSNPLTCTQHTCCMFLRVPVIDGHTECVSVRFSRQPPPSPQQELEETLQMEEKKLCDNFKDLFEPIPHIDELPTDFLAEIKLKDPKITVKN
jgi:hypothetical protein